MKNLDSINKELGPEPILPRGFTDFFKKTCIIWYLILGVYIIINADFGYSPTKRMLNEGMNKKTIEEKIFESYKGKSITGEKFVMKITKPGRELAYYLHSADKK